MRHPCLPLVLAAGAVLALACSDDLNPPGADGGRDGSGSGAEAGADLRPPDLALPDLALPDLPLPDMSPPDLPPPDMAPPDAPPPDLPLPDLPLPDLPLPDLLPPDLPPPANDTCAKAKVLTFVGGKISEQGDTSGAANEFGTGITCGGFSPYDGPQRYYRIKLTAGKLYSVKVSPGPTFDPALYALPASSGCTSTGVSAGCKGQVTDVIGKGNSGVETLTLKPSTSEDWLLVVDAYAATEKGPFTLEVSEAQPASNDKCAKALVMPLAGGKAIATGDTSTATNEHGTSISCGTSYDYDGPQLYYRVVLPANKTFKITATPKTAWDLSAYAFTDATCTASVISSQCAGWIADSGGKGKAESFFITTQGIQQNYILAVDSYTTTQKGAFELKVEEFAVANNSLCAGGTPLTMVAGAVTVTGDTGGAINQFGGVKCGGGTALAGPQLYYKVTFTAGQTYRVTVAPQFSATLYLAPATSCTSGAALEAACSSGGASGAKAGPVGQGQARTLYFTPATTGDHVLAVDSAGYNHKGTFTLTVQAFTPANNGACSAALKIAPAGAKSAASGDISGVKDEYSGLKCGASPALAGPQLYYTFRAQAARAYRLRLQADFPAHLYLAEKSKCGDAAKLTADCSGGGVQGDYWGATTPGGWISGYFTKPADIDYLVAVESTTAPAKGKFKLQLAELLPANNEACSGAATLTFSSGQARSSGDTFVRKDEVATLKCGGATALSGPQLYYGFTAAAGKTYRLALYPQFKGQLYVFPKAVCGSATTMEAACASGGVSGAILSSPVSPLSGGELLFSPATPGDYIVAVDSTSSTNSGAFDLTVSEVAMPTVNAPFSWGFDVGCQGLSATGDWECGLLDFAGSPACAAGATPPSSGHSGKGVWGTRLDDCHAARGNNAHTSCKAASASDDSVLSFQVALPSTWTQATLSYWAWDDSHTPDDWSEVRLDGVPVPATQTCAKASYLAPTAWVQRTVDLTAKLGKTVTVAFHFSAGTSTNHAGLYLDDISVSGM